MSEMEPAAPAPEVTTPDHIARGLFPHQIEGVAFLLRRRRAILADDMGLGKTRQAITALEVEEPAGPYLVICPATVKRNWAREIKIVLPGATVRLLAGASDSAPLPGASRRPRLRIGQGRTVNVSYLVAAGTVDDFVEAVLQAKAALIGAVIEGGGDRRERGCAGRAGAGRGCAAAAATRALTTAPSASP
jgi:SNF2 family DNA or RNA helicase